MLIGCHVIPAMCHKLGSAPILSDDGKLFAHHDIAHVSTVDRLWNNADFAMLVKQAEAKPAKRGPYRVRFLTVTRRHADRGNRIRDGGTARP